MSRGPENTFIASVHRHIDPDVAYAMKNHNEYNGGIADCWYSGKAKRSRDLWIEWKFIEIPKRDTTVIDLMGGKNPILSHLQQEWLKDRYNEGRNVWVGVGSANGGVIFADLEWQQPFTAKEFRELMMPRKELADRIVSFVQGHA